jgi:DNA-directed RNA polymerase, mitochondrial
MSVGEQLRRLDNADLRQEYSCLNALQRTAWQINKPLLEVLRTVWDSGQQWGKLPAKDDLPLPMYPFDRDPRELTGAERQEFLLWSRQRNAIYSHNNRTVSKRIQVERTLQVAEDYAKNDEFYYVWQNDFRSRKYASCTFLSPQSADWSKSLLTFRNGVAINNWDDARWLCIHGANLYGNDKITLDQREGWAWDKSDEFVRIAENPYDNLLWLEADKPYQFLAWCFEFAQLVRQGWGYLSTLPVSADGSCNGLQHLSAILRDTRGGRATNLLPAAQPQDIYTEVAMEAMARVMLEDTEMSRQWKRFGVTRKLTKRPVMIVPYSGTKHSCRAYIQEAMEEQINETGDNPFGDDLFPASVYLANYVWDAISNVIVSASKVMDYIKSVGDVYADVNKHMEWVTPTGWLVLQSYNNTTTKRIKTHINGEIVKLNMLEEGSTVSRRRTGTGSSPNFIHSLDAAAMTKTINACVNRGILDFAMVHDSYGTHSSHMPMMSDLIRQEFVKMYEEHDVLTELRDHAIQTLGTEDVPLPPVLGDLDIRRVLESEYFFA